MLMKTSTLFIPALSAAFGAALTFFALPLRQEAGAGPAPVQAARFIPSPGPAPIQAPPAPPSAPSSPAPAGTPVDFREAANVALDAVVHIRTAQRVQSGNSWSPFWGQPPQAGIQRGSGSGVILDAAGYIVTNHHVIDGADDIEVGLNDNRSMKAELIGSDPATDIAVLRIDAGNLTALEWGNSDDVQVGDWVLAVGNPFDLTSTVTAGIVSAKARDIQLLRPDYERDVFPVESFIQTDAAVNPGNSGGALVDTRGRLMGINTAIASRTGSYAGYAFAVPSNLARKVAADLIEFGRVQRAYLGVTIRPVEEALASSLGLPEVEGVLVVGTTPGSGAEEAGLKEGDVILSVGGSNTSSLPALMERVNQFRPGQSTTVDIWRDGQLQRFEVELRDRDGNTEMVSASATEAADISMVLGAQLQDADDGVLVVEPGEGALGLADIPANTRILAIDGQRVTRTSDLVEGLETAMAQERKAVLLEATLPNGRSTWFGVGLR
ncbi:MAG: PDZ domain-containing protein [Crocinitomicaceae bacterium TMED114]|nr:MAG: PDZ domain-containing protein [Crocinitomicaceae bacterium TMED114]RPG81554.1 MAG: PDZ domain-containing protein [Crocinitomicaceae bacterium TMED114]